MIVTAPTAPNERRSGYFARLKIVSVLPPVKLTAELAVTVSSSAERPTVTFTSFPPRLGLSAPSTFRVHTLLSSSTDQVPNWATNPLAAAANSSVLKAAAYSADETLKLEFRTGPVYRYFDVPSAIFQN